MNLPVYFLSFFKLPKKVKKEFIKVQKNFLWISWRTVCREKEEGGIGIKDLELFNKFLLTKWLWRFINDKDLERLAGGTIQEFA